MRCKLDPRGVQSIDWDDGILVPHDAGQMEHFLHESEVIVEGGQLLVAQELRERCVVEATRVAEYRTVMGLMRMAFPRSASLPRARCENFSAFDLRSAAALAATVGATVGASARESPASQRVKW